MRARAMIEAGLMDQQIGFIGNTNFRTFKELTCD